MEDEIVQDGAAAPGVSDEQAAHLARLQAGASEQEAEAAAALPQEPDGPDPVQETAAMLSMVIAMASPLLPYLPTIYDDATVQRLAGAYVPVAEKYGWQSGGFFEKWGAEIVLAATVLPVAAQTRAAHLEWVAEREAKSKPKEGKVIAAKVVAEPAPSQGVTFGAVAEPA